MPTTTKKSTVKTSTEASTKDAVKPVVKATKAVSAKGPSRSAEALAVIMTGGKQYKVKVGDVLKIEKIIGEYKVGDTISFTEVLLIDEAGKTIVGKPHIEGSVVEAELKEIGRAPKIMVIHFKQKSKYFKKYGHRQPFFTVAITSIA